MSEEIAGELPLFERSPFHLPQYPKDICWEVTRRHPYYLGAWQLHCTIKELSPTDRADLFENQKKALLARSRLFLEAIGCFGDPVDPNTPPTEMVGDLSPAFLSGAVTPLTIRGIVGVLLLAAPAGTLRELSELFQRTAVALESTGEWEARMTALRGLDDACGEYLQTYLQEPVVVINPAATHRQLTESLKALLNRWKEERNLNNTRQRADKYSEYLEVWDLREGWSNGCYDPSREHTFQEIAARLKRPLETVANQYYKGFEMVIARAYSPEVWCRIMYLSKAAAGGNESGGTRRRPLKSRSRSPATVSESTLGQPVSGLVTHDYHVSELAELAIDISEGIAQGLSDEAIIKQNEMIDCEESWQFIRQIRGRSRPAAAGK